MIASLWQDIYTGLKTNTLDTVPELVAAARVQNRQAKVAAKRAMIYEVWKQQVMQCEIC